MTERKERGGVMPMEVSRAGDCSGSPAQQWTKGSGHKGRADSRARRPHAYKPPQLPPHRGDGNVSRGRRQSEQRFRGRYEQSRKAFDELSYIEKELRDPQRKKTGPISLTHLLNFTVASHEMVGDGTVGHGYVSGGRRGRKPPYHHHLCSKDQFLQANCQFVVKDGGDYVVHAADPDLVVDWKDVQQVRLFCHEIPTCPICLYPPKAAKITHCGHVYCSSCILHYLSLSERKWHKCPICYEAVYKKDLKSVTALTTKSYALGDTISMMLMARQKGSCLVLPLTEWKEELPHLVLPLGGGSGYDQFSRLLTASDQQLLDILAAERRELVVQLASLSPDQESEKCFIECALEDLREREESLKSSSRAQAQTDPPLPPMVEDPKSAGHHESIVSLLSKENTEGPDSLKACTDLGSSRRDGVVSAPMEGKQVLDEENDSQGLSLEHNESGISSSASSDLGLETSKEFESSAEIPCPKSELVHFYQATDGSHTFIHPINTKCILKEYGSWEKCPQVVSAKIVEMEQCVMTEDERKRSRHLNHLPLMCQFVLCELDLKPPVVSTHTLDHFSEQLQRRYLKRQKKKREERRREKRMVVKNKASGPVSLPANPADISPEHLHDFLSMASSPPLPSFVQPPLGVSPPTAEPPSRASPDKLVSGSDAADSGLPMTGSSDDSSPPSFAQALARGEAKGFSSDGRVRNSANAVVVRPSDEVDDGEGGEEGDATVPSFQDAFSEALVTASQSVLAASQQRGGRPGGSKAAKKGRKKLVLFTTGGTRRAT